MNQENKEIKNNRHSTIKPKGGAITQHRKEH